MIKYFLLFFTLVFFSFPILAAECNGFHAYYNTNEGKKWVCAPNYGQHLPLSQHEGKKCVCWWSGCGATSSNKNLPTCSWSGCKEYKGAKCKMQLQLQQHPAVE